ncbi:MAG: endonuclease/exonuclease/phosphatase family protein, partial [Aeromonas sp.]
MNYKTYEDRWPYGPSVWSGDNKNRSSGVAILFRGQSFKIIRTQEVINGRLLCVDVAVDNIPFRIINVYCSPDLQDRIETLKTIAPLLVCGQPVVMGGDFNCLIAKEDRKSSSTVKLDSSSEELKNLIHDFKLIDSFRSQNLDIPGFTWSNGYTFSRIDYMFITPEIKVINSLTKPVFFSDHAKIDCQLDIGRNRKRGPGIWKLNVSLLDNQEVVILFREKLNQWISLQEMYTSIGEWWEDFKIRVKKFFIRESKRLALKNRLIFSKHQRRLQKLYVMAQSGFDVIDDITSLKSDLKKLYNCQSKGCIIRSRIQHLESNEKCT